MGIGIEGKHSAVSPGLTFMNLLVREIRQTRIENPGDFLLLCQPFGNAHGIFLCCFHADRKRLDAPDGEPAVKGREAAAYRRIQVMNTLSQLRVPAYGKSCKRIIVACQEFRAAVNDNVCAQIERVAEIGAHERIIHDQERSVAVSNFRSFPDIRDLHHRVGRCFHIQGLYRIIKVFLDAGRVGGIDEAEVDAVLLIDEAEKTDGAAVQIIRGKDGIAGTEKLHDHGNGCHAGGVACASRTVFQCGYHLFAGIPCGVAEAGIIIAGGLAELRMTEGGALKNRDGNAACCISSVAAVNTKCFDVHNIPPWICTGRSCKCR